MTPAKGKLQICSRGHTFYKSRTCPVCPMCWPGHRKKLQSDFPEKLSAPALRGIHNAKIIRFKDLTKYTEKEISKLHDVGPHAIQKLKGVF